MDEDTPPEGIDGVARHPQNVPVVLALHQLTLALNGHENRILRLTESIKLLTIPTPDSYTQQVAGVLEDTSREFHAAASKLRR